MSGGRSVALAALAAFLGGCASIHSYDAAREINGAHTLSVSGSVGTTLDDRDRTGDGKKDGLRQERVLVPDAKLNIQVPVNEVLSIAFDPLPPAIGAGVVLQVRPEVEWAPRITFAPMASRLVFPDQNVWSIDAPLAFSYRVGVHWVVYAGPKYVYQTHVLKPETGPVSLFFSHVPDRVDHPLEFEGVFAGFAFGFLHVQVSPEVIWYESRRHDGEHVLQVGSQLRLSL